MNSVSRTATGIRTGLRSFFREPFTIVLLLVLPAVSIQIYGVGLGQFSGLAFFDVSHSLETVGRVTGAVFAAGALAGVLGLFQMVSASEADDRLALCGYGVGELIAIRFVTVLALSSIIGLVATVTLTGFVSNSVAVGAAFVGFLLAGIVYGMLGVLVGSVLPRELEGSLVLVVLADVDNVFASGLFSIGDAVTRFAPLSHPHSIVTEAVVDGTFATEHLVPSLAHVTVFAMFGVVAYGSRIRRGGDA